MFGNFINNKKERKWVYFWKNGNPRIQISYNNNSLEGPIKIYYESGELMFEGNATKGNDEIRMKKYMKYGKEIKTTKLFLSEIVDVCPCFGEFLSFTQ